MAERFVPAGDAQICTESFGDPGDPAILLIMGQGASMLWWREAFCEQLARAGRFVLRYDHRDTGRSTSYEPGRPGYSGAELASDAVAVLDGYGIERAHVVGLSMGGALAQLLALGRPWRLASLTLIDTTRVDDWDDSLPGPAPAYKAYLEAASPPDWTDPDAIVENLVAESRALAGRRHPFDEDELRALARRDVERMQNPATLQNHPLLEQAPDPTGSLAELQVPLLVIHGTDDPLFPFAHGEALARAVPGATLVAVQGGGHEIHREDLEQVVEAIVGVTA
jgi:pimeloyl-ACP methyl ester carboxylesterase